MITKKEIERGVSSQEIAEDDEIFSAIELNKEDIKPLTWIVKGIIPREGILILVAPPKAGKSLFILNIILDAVLGLNMLGTCDPCKIDKVLYIDLEDGKRRAKDRMGKILQGEPYPENLHFALVWPRIGNGGLEKLRDEIEKHGYRLIVIDTFGKLQSPRKSANQYSYQHDIKDINELREIATEYDIPIILIHHTRKQGSNDWIDLVSGTHGIAGSADTLLFLERDRGSTDGTLYVSGRDVDEASYKIIFDKDTCSWTIAGLADGSELSKPRMEILNLLRSYDGTMSPKEIAEKLGKTDGSVKKQLANLVRNGDVLRPEHGQYTDRIRG
ncbi:AAA family ATPase [Candidatus Latescibacterota bacterium]